MSREQTSTERTVKQLEDEVAAFKTSQPFYDGQFTPYDYQSELVYDFTFTTNHAVTRFDMTINITSSPQPNVIFEPYFQFYLTDNTMLGINRINYLVNHRSTLSSGPVASIEVNCSTNGLPVGTTVGVKLFYILSADVDGTITRGVRP